MKKITSSYMKKNRLALGLTQTKYAELISEYTGRRVTRDMIAQYEQDRAWVPGDFILAIQVLQPKTPPV